MNIEGAATFQMRQLTREQMEQYETDGYVVVRGFLDPDKHLLPVLNEYEEVLDALVRSLFSQGKIASLHKDLPFEERLTKVVCRKWRGSFTMV